jgi:ribonuclease Z
MGRGAGAHPIPLELIPLSKGQVFDAGEFTVDCFPVRHHDTDGFAFTFEVRARRHLLPKRLAALGVPDGPARGELAAGRPVTLQDGRTRPPARGAKLVVVGTPNPRAACLSTSGTPTCW